MTKALKEQKTFLDSLDHIVTEQTTPTVTRDFNKYKSLLLSTSDSLAKQNLTKTQSDSLKTNLIKYRRSISDLLVNTAENKTIPTKHTP